MNGEIPLIAVVTQESNQSIPTAKLVFDEATARRVWAELQETREWGIYIVTGPCAGDWCHHTIGKRIETDDRTARTIALLFTERFEHQHKYEARRLPVEHLLRTAALDPPRTL